MISEVKFHSESNPHVTKIRKISLYVLKLFPPTPLPKKMTTAKNMTLTKIMTQTENMTPPEKMTPPIFTTSPSIMTAKKSFSA